MHRKPRNRGSRCWVTTSLLLWLLHQPLERTAVRARPLTPSCRNFRLSVGVPSRAWVGRLRTAERGLAHVGPRFRCSSCRSWRVRAWAPTDRIRPQWTAGPGRHRWRGRSAHACTPVLHQGEAVLVLQERRRLDAAWWRTSTRPVGEQVVDSRPRTEPGVQLEPALTGLLDHVAEELAREYVRLMEVAARDAGSAERGGADEARGDLCAIQLPEPAV